MATRFTSLGVAGTLVVAGLTTLATVAVTTLTVTTGNFTTANIQTLSGATIKAEQASGIIEARTLSGNVLKSYGLTASGKVVLSASDGGHVCYRDTDNAGWTQCDALNGTQTCRIASAGQCP